MLIKIAENICKTFHKAVIIKAATFDKPCNTTTRSGQYWAATCPTSVRSQSLAPHKRPTEAARRLEALPRKLSTPSCGGARTPVKMGSGRYFERTVAPTQPWVGGVLRQHWMKWQDVRVEPLIISTLLSSYCISFHHLLPVTWEPIEFRLQYVAWGP